MEYANAQLESFCKINASQLVPQEPQLFQVLAKNAIHPVNNAVNKSTSVLHVILDSNLTSLASSAKLLTALFAPTVNTYKMEDACDTAPIT